MKRKRKNGEAKFTQWITRGIRNSFSELWEELIEDWIRVLPTARMEGCLAWFGLITGVFIVIWACCGLTISMTLGFSNWYPTLFYGVFYLIACLGLCRVIFKLMYALYMDDIEGGDFAQFPEGFGEGGNDDATTD